ncbi:MAG: phenylalanine--tRNA ligase subunit beta [Ignavibacteriae bacterium]|nr:phenylalanine--tRNA ligase subunit beta [Ignavibacteriota bacterium]MCB9217142.1 phenylalanine--tRNA ligase subunit beta [Ignavibacteria bacterium]
MPTSAVTESGLKGLVEYDLSPEYLVERLIQLGLEVDSFDDRGAKLKGFIVAEVVEKSAHENADKLSVCKVNTGEGDPVTVVCGAPNVAAGQKIAFAPVGTEIPDAGFTIEKRKIRGVVSEGMICSERELGIGESHEGILVLEDNLQPGTPLPEVFGDVIYHVEVTPNRGDCLSHLGVAREISAITGNPVMLPDAIPQEVDEKASDAIVVEIEAPDLCPRYAARVVKGVNVAPSPLWLQDALKKIGVRPINNVVDVASYVMFETGHPLHAFDYDQVGGKKIIVRPAGEGEKFTTLDSKERTLSDGALLICDADRAVAIAGVMGGENSEITDTSVNVLIESAWFNPSSIRKTARSLGLATDASYRFERGADINVVEYAANRAASLIAEIAGGEVLSGIVDEYPGMHTPTRIDLRFKRTNDILGMELTPERQTEILSSLGCRVIESDNVLVRLDVPSWRTDITLEIDLIEEIARVHGYSELPTDPRALIGAFVEVEPLQDLIRRTRQFFVANGFAEVVAPYQTDPDSAQRYGKAIELRNALGLDTSYMRTNLLPGLGRIVGLNQRHSRPDLRLFEIGKAFREGREEEGAVSGIVEVEELALVLSGSGEPVAWDRKDYQTDIYDLRGIIDRYMAHVGVRHTEYRPVEEERWGIGSPALALFVHGEEIGRLGPLDTWIKERHDLSGNQAILLLDLEKLSKLTQGISQYVPPSKYPSVERDISVLLDAGILNAEVERAISAVGGELLQSVRLFDLYQGKGIPESKKSMSYSLTFGSEEKTLEDEEVDQQVMTIVKELSKQFGAELRS